MRMEKYLVNKGVTLQERILQRLIQLGITYIYIDDKQTEEIEFQIPYPIQLKEKPLQRL